MIGASIGTRSGLMGSIGLFAKRKGGRLGFITSPDALGPLGKDVIGESVFQPGALSQGLSERTRIGTIRAVVTEIDDASPARYGAFVELLEEVSVDTDLPVKVGELRRFKDVSHEPISLLSPVAKLGCTSGLTFGKISAVDLTLRINAGGRTRREFRGLIEIRSGLEPFSLPGDGGAAVFNPDTGYVLGLIVAGAEGEEPQSYAVPLLPTLERLELVLA
jgi:hypothetical protein